MQSASCATCEAPCHAVQLLIRAMVPSTAVCATTRHDPMVSSWLRTVFSILHMVPVDGPLPNKWHRHASKLHSHPLVLRLSEDRSCRSCCSGMMPSWMARSASRPSLSKPARSMKSNVSTEAMHIVTTTRHGHLSGCMGTEMATVHAQTVLQLVHSSCMRSPPGVPCLQCPHGLPCGNLWHLLCGVRASSRLELYRTSDTTTGSRLGVDFMDLRVCDVRQARTCSEAASRELETFHSIAIDQRHRVQSNIWARLAVNQGTRLMYASALLPRSYQEAPRPA